MMDNTVVGNFEASEEELYRRAIQEYGDPDFKICDDAYDLYGYKLNGLKSLHYYGSKSDIGDFWRILRKLEVNN